MTAGSNMSETSNTSVETTPVVITPALSPQHQHPHDHLPVSSVSTGYDHTCALVHDGYMHCWGDNEHGQVVILARFERFTRAITTGYDHTCALDRAGGLECWGWNRSGQCNVPLDLWEGVHSVAAGWGHSCAIDSKGIGYCWGINIKGQARVPRMTQLLLAVVTGNGFNCVQRIDLSVFCWGNNTNGETDVPAELTVEEVVQEKAAKETIKDEVVDIYFDQKDRSSAGTSAETVRS